MGWLSLPPGLEKWYPPNIDKNKQGHLLLGIGAISLAAGFAMWGEPGLVLISGGLHAIGKFGSFATETREEFKIAVTFSPLCRRDEIESLGKI